MTDRTLAIGTCYMNAPEFFLRISQVFAKRDGIGKILFISRTAHVAEYGQCLIKIFNRLRVCHAAKISLVILR